MRIMLIVAAMDTGGVETHIFSLARQLQKMGDEVTVVSSGGRLANRLSEEGIEHIALRADRASPLSVLRGRVQLCRMVADRKIELIHAHSRISAFLAYPVARRYGIPFLTTAHACFSTPPIYRRLSRWGRPTIAVGQDLFQYLVDNYALDGENIRVIPNGIDTAVFCPSEEARQKKRIVFMSRLDGDCSSAALSLCAIGEKLYRCFSDLQIVICGGGEMLPLVRDRADRVCESVGERFIIVRGHVERAEEELRRADIFVGVSRAALEALGCGALTVLCGDEGGLGFMDSREMLLWAEQTNFCCRGEKRLSDEELFYEISRALSLAPERVGEIRKMGEEYVRDMHSQRTMATKTRLLYEEARSIGNRSGRVVLCGYYGYGNMGDNALLRSSIKRARLAYPEREICALTAGGRRDTERFGVRCMRRMNPLSVMAALFDAEALILGGGTLLQDRTSLRSLVYYAAVCRFAALRGVRIELWGNGLTEPVHRAAEVLVRGVLESAAYIGVRDMPSATVALRLISPQCADRLYLERDLALTQRAATPERVEFLLRRLGLCAGDRHTDYAVVAVKGSDGEGFVKILESELFALAEEGMALLFLPMFPREDGALCRRLAQSLGGAVAQGLSESDAVGLMRGASVVCGMRLHALVFAAAAGVPFVGIGADPKIEGFCRENGGLFLTDIL